MIGRRMIASNGAKHQSIDAVGDKIKADGPQTTEETDKGAENQVAALGMIGEVNQDFRNVFFAFKGRINCFYKEIG